MSARVLRDPSRYGILQTKTSALSNLLRGKDYYEAVTLAGREVGGQFESDWGIAPAFFVQQSHDQLTKLVK